MLMGRHILLGVSGGIAAYKSATLVRDFMKAGAEVQVIMTPAAGHFITPLTLGTLSKRPVISEMFPGEAGASSHQWTAHIDLALWADIMVVAPATADTIAKLAHGFADSFLAATALALRCPLAVAPSMDLDMYRHPATQENLAVLRRRGVHILEPESGELASGLFGQGRLPEPQAIATWVDTILIGETGDLEGKTIVVTAGPTQEPIDPVRYIGNRSSGKMGFAIAEAAVRRGASVTLIAGPVSLATPKGLRRVDVTTAREMRNAVMEAFDACDALIMSAAVADFTPSVSHDRKVKREQIDGERFTLDLAKSPDILKEAGQRKNRQILVGFALETDNGIEHARAKLSAKQLDIIVLNNPLEEGAGFGSDSNAVVLLASSGEHTKLPLLPKIDVAHRILDALRPLLP